MVALGTCTIGPALTISVVTPDVSDRLGGDGTVGEAMFYLVAVVRVGQCNFNCHELENDNNELEFIDSKF